MRRLSFWILAFSPALVLVFALSGGMAADTAGNGWAAGGNLLTELVLAAVPVLTLLMYGVKHDRFGSIP